MAMNGHRSIATIAAHTAANEGLKCRPIELT
jgi:hypothetical protein